VTTPVLVCLSLRPVTDGGSGFLLHRPDDLVDKMVPENGDVVLLEQALLQNALGTELVAAMHDRHALGEVGKVERFLDSRVAAADDDQRPCRGRRSRRRWRKPRRRSP
jgi:hypothetical protein